MLSRWLLCWSVLLGLTSGALFAQDTPGQLTTDDAPVPWAPVQTLPKFAGWVTALAFSPDGQQLAVGQKNGVELFRTTTWERISRTPLSLGTVSALAWSPDQKWLAIGGYQKLLLTPADLNSEPVALSGHKGIVQGLAFSPDGRQLVSVSDDETSRLWDLSAVSSGKISESKVLAGDDFPVNCVAWSRDGQRIATAAGDEFRPTKSGQVVLRDKEGAALKTWTDHSRAALCAAFSSDGKLLVTGGLDERALVYDLEADKLLGFFGGHQRPVNAVRFLPDSEIVISIGGGRAKGGHSLRAWTARDGGELAIGEAHPAKILALAVSTDGKLVATGGQDNTVMVWETAAFRKSNGQDVVTIAAEEPAREPKVLRIGVIGLDTSHAPAFAKLLNDPKAAEDIAGCKIVAAYPKGSPDIESSTSRVPDYVAQFKDMGIEIVDTIPALLEKVDCVLLETNDGRPHLEQLLPVLKAGKPCFIDKPVAGTLADAIAIYEASEKYKVPVFSSSSLRFMEGAQKVRNGSVGKVLGCDAYSPCSLEATHPDLFWYGIHGVEILFTVMGTGCESVTRVHTPGVDVVTGTWNDGRVGTFRGIREGKASYGGHAYGDKGATELGGFGGYRPLLVEIIRFFKTGKAPVSPEETLEIYAFMEAADESKRQGGVPVKLADVMEKARAAAKIPE